jgi:hypothetical protein
MRDASIDLPRRTGIGAGRVVLLIATAAALGGCASSGTAAGAFAMAGDAPAIAFESIDGPPPPAFDRMVSVLDSESKLRNLLIVSRESAAAFRVRSYLAAQVHHGKTVISWVWDIYDRDQQRALRLSGQEPAGKAGRDAWAAADDVVLRKIAQTGLSGLANMINGTPEPARPGPSPERKARVVASTTPIPSTTSAFAAIGDRDR